jgi:hypothetical protein
MRVACHCAPALSTRARTPNARGKAGWVLDAQIPAVCGHDEDYATGSVASATDVDSKTLIDVLGRAGIQGVSVFANAIGDAWNGRRRRSTYA